MFSKEHYTDHFKEGMYACKNCGHPLFASDTKFKSGTRWPSFRDALQGAVTFKPDKSFGMNRTEVLCANCSEHLGHVFDDGAYTDTHPDAGKRYCILSNTLDFKDEKEN